MNAPVPPQRGSRKKRWHVASSATLAAAMLAAALAAWARQPDGEVLPLRPQPLEAVSAHPSKAEDRHLPLAVVLGGGGLRGFAHIGVLRALEEHRIRPDILVGTSAGALVGAAYASGATVEALEAAAGNIDIPSLMDWTLKGGGLMQGAEIGRWVDRATGGQRIEQFPIRFGAVATDLDSGNAVLLDSGKPGDAVRASAAVPGATVPVAYPGGRLVDGGVSSLVPVRFARAMGGHKVIAVDIYCSRDKLDELSATRVLRRSMHLQACLLSKPELAEADLIIRVDVPMPEMSGEASRREAIRAGYKAADAALKAARFNEI